MIKSLFLQAFTFIDVLKFHSRIFLYCVIIIRIFSVNSVITETFLL